MISQLQLPCAAFAALALLSALTSANPLSENVPTTTTTAPPTAIGTPFFGPSCFPLSPYSTNTNTNKNASNTLTSYLNDCDRAIDSFINYPTLSQQIFLWYRMGPHPIPPSGTQSLPYTVEKGLCVVQLDVLDEDEPKAYDRLALRGLKYIVEALADRCVRPYVREVGGGVVAVGRKKVLGVTIRSRVWVGGNGESSMDDER